MGLFKKRVCEKCGKEYRLRTVSENRGRFLCPDCIKKCLNCGKPIPRENYLGETTDMAGAVFGGPVLGSVRVLNKPWIGSGLCVECFMKTQQKTP